MSINADQNRKTVKDIVNKLVAELEILREKNLIAAEKLEKVKALFKRKAADNIPDSK